MKKLLFLLILAFPACKKESCYTCVWTADSPYYHNTTYTALTLETCDKDQMNQWDGSESQVVDGSGKKVWAKCNCY